MKKTTIGLLAALAAVSVAGAARAQICAGYPTTDRQFAFGANMQFPEGADFGQVWGVEASYNATGLLSFAGGVTFVDPEGDDNTEKGYGVGFALEFPSINTRNGPVSRSARSSASASPALRTSVLSGRSRPASAWAPPCRRAPV